MYRKKPIAIEAVRWTANSINKMQAFMGTYPKVINRRIRIKTPAGALYADEGDFIIKGVNGEFYPCKPDAFKKAYEEC